MGFFISTIMNIQIMKAALEDLASQGNETARVALMLASKVDNQSSEDGTHKTLDDHGIVDASFLKHTCDQIDHHTDYAIKELKDGLDHYVHERDFSVNMRNVSKSLTSIKSMTTRLTMWLKDEKS